MPGRIGKAFKVANHYMKQTGPNARWAMGRVANTRQARSAFHAIGSRSVSNEARVISGRRRAMIGGTALGAGLGINAVLGPRAGNSSGGRGYQYPRSTGGYA